VSGRGGASRGAAVSIRGTVGCSTGIGYDIREATFTAAQTRTDEDRPYPLHDAEIGAVTAYLSHKRGPDCGLSGAQLLYRTGLFAQAEVIAMTLYAAAAELAGMEFDPEDFGDFR
jgi:hypothetical protein